METVAARRTAKRIADMLGCTGGAQPYQSSTNIVTPDKYDLWLSPEVEDFDAVREILKPYDSALMRHYPVNPRVSSVQNDDADCAAAITLELPEQALLF
jgi:hypothetical protein